MMSEISKYYWTSFGDAPVAVIEEDIRRGGVKDERIIRAALQVHPGEFRPWDLLPRPAIVAGIAEALQPTAESKVLEVGTGTGYLTAVLAVLSQRVISIEMVPVLATIARNALEQQPYGSRITVVEGDGLAGYPEEAPYDCICIHGCARHVPPPLLEQLGDGGRFFLAVGSEKEQQLQLITRNGRDFSTKVLGNGRFAVLLGPDQR